VAKAEPEAKPEPAKEPPKEEQQQAALAPQPPPNPQPPPPTLEKGLAAAGGAAGAADLTRNPAAGTAAAAPSAAEATAAGATGLRGCSHRSSFPPAAHQQLPSSPLSHIPQTHSPAEPQQAARPAPTPFTNPADVYGPGARRRRIISGTSCARSPRIATIPRAHAKNSEEGLVVALVTIARDGRLLDVAISRSSGYKALDSAVMEVIRAAAPYAPLPNDVAGRPAHIRFAAQLPAQRSVVGFLEPID